jgi:hypothetical protein
MVYGPFLITGEGLCFLLSDNCKAGPPLALRLFFCARGKRGRSRSNPRCRQKIWINADGRCLSNTRNGAHSNTEHRSDTRMKKCCVSGEGTLSNFQNPKVPPTGRRIYRTNAAGLAEQIVFYRYVGRLNTVLGMVLIKLLQCRQVLTASVTKLGTARRG